MVVKFNTELIVSKPVHQVFYKIGEYASTQILVMRCEIGPSQLSCLGSSVVIERSV